MTEDPRFRIVCPACGEDHYMGLAALRDEPAATIELFDEIAKADAEANAAVACSARSLRRIRWLWILVAVLSCSAAGGYAGGADHLSKWWIVLANATTAITALTGAAFVVDLKIWSLRP